MIDFLREHRHPLTLAALAEALGTSRREVELAVNQARLDGHPIVSDSDGIRYTDNPEEVRECALRLRSRLANQAKTSRSLLNTARRLEAQKELTLPW